MFGFDLENPVITETERNGMPETTTFPVCQRCGRYTSEFVYDVDGNIVGCPECVRFREAWEVMVYGEK